MNNFVKAIQSPPGAVGRDLGQAACVNPLCQPRISWSPWSPSRRH